MLSKVGQILCYAPLSWSVPLPSLRSAGRLGPSLLPTQPDPAADFGQNSFFFIFLQHLQRPPKKTTLLAKTFSVFPAESTYKRQIIHLQSEGKVRQQVGRESHSQHCFLGQLDLIHHNIYPHAVSDMVAMMIASRHLAGQATAHLWCSVCWADPPLPPPAEGFFWIRFRCHDHHLSITPPYNSGLQSYSIYSGIQNRF